MFRARTLSIFGLAAAAAIFALPADAAQRGERRDGRGAQQQQQDGPPPGGGRQAVPRGAVDGSPRPGQQDGAPSAVVQGRGYRGPATVPYRGPVYRPYPGPVYGSYRPPVFGPYRWPVYASPYRYSHPYYTFRPRVSIGVGFWGGFAVPFPSYAYGSVYPYPGAYGYGAPYPVPYPVPYAAPYPSAGYPAPGYPSSGYPAQAPPAGGVTAVPGAPAYGGISIEVTPSDAEVWVDGGYAGRADDFGPQARPLTLAAGLHRIEVRAPGFVPLAFDVTVTPGYVVPYQGVLQPGFD